MLFERFNIVPGDPDQGSQHMKKGEACHSKLKDAGNRRGPAGSEPPAASRQIAERDIKTRLKVEKEEKAKTPW
jgi:hypothetical protein